jgi:thymidylate synthase (FAD)
MEPNVTLISWTKNPIETIWKVWMASKHDTPLDVLQKDMPSQEDMLDLFQRVVEQRIPVSEHLDFVFIMANVSISWREQAVRHRIGIHVGDRLGVDIVPDLADSSWWSQSMRVMDLGAFADERRYRMPESIEDDSKASELYKSTMTSIQDAYAKLIKMGVPIEDARELIPLGIHHRISWKLNLAAIQHTIGKRTCWITQGSLWMPIIMGMVQEMTEKVHPVFRNLTRPPCVDSSNCYGTCILKEENRRRMLMDDAMPTCPLYLHHECGYDVEYLKPLSGVPMVAELHDRANLYRQFWAHDPYQWGDK